MCKVYLDTAYILSYTGIAHMPPTAPVPTAKAPTDTRQKTARKLRPIWVSVRAKITLPFLLLSIALALAIAFVLYQVVFENINQRFNNQLIESGRLASEWMVQEENRRLDTLRLVAYTDGVGDALQAGNAEQLRLSTLGITVGHQEDLVEFLDNQGRLVLSMRHRPDSQNLEDYVFSSGGNANYLQWPFVEKVIKGEADSQGDKYSGLARADWGDIFYISGPVYNSSGQLAGVVLVGKTMSNLVRNMRQEILAQVTIYGMNGEPIASTFTSSPITPEEVNNILARQADSSLRRDDGSPRSLTYSNIDYAELLGVWKLRGSQDAGLIGTSLPKNFLIQTSNLSKIQLVIILGSGLILVLSLGGLVANWITRPLPLLVKASKEVTHGNLKVQVKADSNDEFTVLAENFNQMITSIKQSHNDLVKAYNSTLEGWSRATDLRDNETGQHVEQVTRLAVNLAQRMGCSGSVLTNIYRGALLHDVGKIGISDTILKKPGPLTSEEWVLMRKHPQYAYEMLAPIEYLRPALDIPYCHHERWDGSGYPRGLKGEEIPMPARIFAVVDVWDAMTSERVYRKALPKPDVLRYVINQRGVGFDPRVVNVFLSMLSEK